MTASTALSVQIPLFEAFIKPSSCLGIWICILSTMWTGRSPTFHNTANTSYFRQLLKAQKSFLFDNNRNNRDWIFNDVAENSGAPNEDGKGLSTVWFDFNSNNWPELNITKDLTRYKLYLNLMEETFTHISTSVRVKEVKSSMGVVEADFGSCRNPGLIISNSEGSYLSLFRNMDDLRFD